MFGCDSQARGFIFPGMKLCVSLFQIGDGQPQVPFHGGQRAVAQQILHVAQVGIVLDQVGGADVPPMPLAA